MPDDVMKRDAMFSPCRQWRYILIRQWDTDGPIMNVIGLNPSTADEQADDPTIRRCISLARRTGHGSLYMTNLFAYRATQPSLIRQALDPIGPDNDRQLRNVARVAQTVVLAWGTNGSYMDRATRTLQMLKWDAVLPQCLGVNRDQSPKHPLYLPNVAELVLYRFGPFDNWRVPL